MRPRNIGRALGIGVRVAGRIAGQRVAAHAASVGTDPQSQPVAPPKPNQHAGQAAGQFASQAAHEISQGIGGFLRPFRRVGGIVWLEVTGVLFLLPVFAFAPTLWRASIDFPHTTDHKAFWASALVVTVFLYLGVSAFWRARHR
jgi:hypothetical protein